MSSSVNNKKVLQRKAKENKNKQYPLLNLYILVISLLEVIGQCTDIFILRMLKPIPLILMIIYISNKSSQRSSLTINLIRVGFVFSLMGDLCLMITQSAAFMIGTIIFLLAHIVYSVALRLGTTVREASRRNKIIRDVVCLVMLFLCLKNIYNLWDLMPNRFLFSTYGIVLCLMTILSVRRYQISTPASYKFTLIGAILFGLSDNLLAHLKFSRISTHYGRGLVLLLYYGGQFLIMHGSIHQLNLQELIKKYYQKGGSNCPPPTLVELDSSSNQKQD